MLKNKQSGTLFVQDRTDYPNKNRINNSLDFLHQFEVIHYYNVYSKYQIEVDTFC